MRIKILCWNVCGLNDLEKRKLIKGVEDFLIGRQWTLGERQEASFSSWDNKVLENLEVESRGYSISVRFRNCADGFSWIFSGVYGLVIGSEKEDFWEELGAIRGLWDDPWCVGGDFNSVRFPEEKRNAPSPTAEMRRFSEVIGELGLRDSPLTGGPFTWIGGLNSQAASRLDRFLISDQWEDHFSAITQSALPRMVSDHSPIVLEAGGFSSGKIPFRFENMWLKIDGFKDLVRSWWNGYSVEGYSSHCMAEKLKALKKDLKIWNKEVVGNVSSNRAEAFTRLQCWEAKEKENPLNPEDMEAKNLALEDYKKWALMEETSWRQKSREIWLREDIKDSVCRTYQSLLSESRDWRPSINGLNFKELEKEWPAAWKLSKVLANRLKSVIGEVISDSQQAFVQGRQILDAVLIANETLDSRLKDNKSGLLLKMDIEKAFDHVNWDFLMEVMSKMRFGHRWINWMKWCCSTTTFSILINGSPSGFFRSSRGLRQGNPLSPYLFLFAMEALSQLLSCARNGGFISSFRVGGREGLIVSHLLFADDTLIFCDAEADQLQYLSWNFMWFEAISGLKVNLSKTEAFPVGEGIPMETLASILGCKIGILPTTYLGLPLGAPYKSTRVWDTVEKRFRKRLSLWKRQYLSKGGRLTLLKSTLSSLPTYFLSLFVIPKKVCTRLEKIQRDFLWGSGALENKPHLVSWKVICAAKKDGGLGIRNLAIFNKALLGKWLWRFANENELLWKQIISRDGTRVKFWKDLWCENQSLEEAFPTLFNLSINKDSWVVEAWEEDGVGESWAPRFNRHLNY
ncbi:LINE-1 reverse transcriptase-like [Vitis vinifera]|uniref:LINE-1 reverse transcriptase-like n=1 Tax=Vitis vinifera TaxID=29760 RepID=A0A438DTP9_VITVI|nr:LINE-1 reverse transcriptase-like [Vitis vinifera]